MGRFVKDFIDVTDQGTLDQMIERLVAVRDGLPEGGKAEVRMRGDDVFGRKLSISFQRPQTAEEAECDARYAEAAQRLSQHDAQHASTKGRRLRIVG